MKVAFIGIGAIGTPMARRLLAVHEVTVFDLDEERVGALVAEGATAASTAADAGRDAALTIVMVATPDQLAAVLDGGGAAGGLAEAVAPGSVVAIMCSVGVDAVIAAEQQLTARGVDVLDVPVTGGVARARTGQLTLLVGGAASLVDRVRPVLEMLGTTLADCGPRVGDGQAVKLVNQLLCSVHLAVAGEALAYAGALGLDPARVLQIVGSGAAGSFMLNDRGPRMLESDPPVFSAIDIFVKDSSLVRSAGGAAGARTPLLDAAAELFADARAAGLGRADDSRVVEMFGDPSA